MHNSELELIEKWQSDPSFIRWVSNENEADVARWNAYFEANPEHIELAEVAKFSMQLKPKTIAKDRAKSLDALATLNKKLDASTYSSPAKVKKLRYFQIWKVAASFLLLAGSFWAYSTFYDNGQEIILATQEEQKEVRLGDGTKVILNAHSTIQYSEKNVRDVKLSGEAYFEVTKQPKTQAPFQVRTKDLTVTVLGTEFNVDSKNEQTSVYLDEGKVKLSLGTDMDKVIEMSPGELVSYSQKTNNIIENRKVKSLTQTAWKEKVILFEEASLSETLEVVSMVYGVNFDTDFDHSIDQLFTGGIPVNNLDVTLNTLKEVYQLNIKKIEEKYILE